MLITGMLIGMFCAELGYGIYRHRAAARRGRYRVRMRRRVVSITLDQQSYADFRAIYDQLSSKAKFLAAAVVTPSLSTPA
jgi:hypothetical protein